MGVNNPFEVCTNQCISEDVEIENLKCIKYIIPYVEKLKLIPVCGDHVLKLDYVLEINYIDKNHCKQKLVKNGGFIFINYGINPKNIKAKVRAFICPCSNKITVKIYGDVGSCKD